MNIVATYKHPQGATIVVYEDGSLVKRDKNDKITKTSATAAKLAAGHGGWVLDEGTVDFTEFNSDREAVPGGVVRIPMKFKSAPISDLSKYVDDNHFAIQQKIDGIRAQIVFEANVPGCWVRSNSGERLKSSASAPVVVAIEKFYEPWTPKTSYCLDGEIINGTFWAFDIVSDKMNDASFFTRIHALQATVSGIDTDIIKLLPTAFTKDEKQALVDKVIANCGEGFIVKNKLSKYIWGGRVDHSLKIKLVASVDCVVTNVSSTKDSISLGVYEDNALIGIGNTSTIGKGEFQAGDVVEVQYLYAGKNGNLVQPTILRKRDDKAPLECLIDQLKYVNKDVVLA